MKKHDIVIREAYKDYTPPVPAKSIVDRLLNAVPQKYLNGLKSVVLTDSANMSKNVRKANVRQAGRTFKVGDGRGKYHQPWQNEPAWIELFVDNCLSNYPKPFLKLAFFRDIALGDVLYHELGHHIHKTQHPKYKKPEAVADEWGSKLMGRYLRKRHWYLLPIAALLKIISLNMKRPYQFILIATFLPLCWLMMQAVHELGHVIGAYATGGGITKVHLHPFIISATSVNPNPHPLIVVWLGPLVGTLLPLAIWAIIKLGKLSGFYMYQFFAGFCLISNGVYIGMGPFYMAGDTDDLIFYGTPAWQMILLGVITIPLGLYLWNNLGTHFGLGEEKGNVDKRAALISFSLLAIVFIVEMVTY